MSFTKINVKKDWKGKKSLLVVDVSAVMRTKYIKLVSAGEAMFASRGAKYRKPLSHMVNGVEMNTSSMFGLFQLFQMYGTNIDYVFCFDSPKNLLKTINKNYKQNAVNMGNDYFDQVNTVYKVLEESGFTVMMQDGYEGIHSVHEAVECNYEKYDHIGIITNEHDMACLVDEKVVWISTLKKNTDITKDNYPLVLECPYNSILLKKCLVGGNKKSTMGNKGDKVLGVRGFGQARFNKFIEEEELYGADIYMNEIDIINDSVTLTDIQQAEALEALDSLLPLAVTVSGRVKTEINDRVLRAFLNKFGMKSIVKLWEVRV